MNQLIADAATETDPDARVALYHQFQQKAADDLPIAPLVEFTFTTRRERPRPERGQQPALGDVLVGRHVACQRVT